MKYDVVVVGAGPAGSRCAKIVAAHGCEVLLIEKREEVGVPVRCGEGVSKRGLEEVGVKPNKNWIASEISSARIHAPNGKWVELSEKFAGGEVGYNLYRDRFDKALAKEAIKAGADLAIGTAVEGVLKKRNVVKGVRAKGKIECSTIQADVVICADGFESQVARWAGIDTRLKAKDIVSCVQYTMTNIEFTEKVNDFYIGSVAPGGYAWIFPKRGEANVGIGVAVNKLRHPGDVKRYLDKFVRRKLPSGKVNRTIAGGVSVCAPIERTIGDGVLVVGDAARQIDPLTGGGVLNALTASNIAGKVVAKAVEVQKFDCQMLAHYESLWRAKLEDKLYRNYIAKEKASKLSDTMLNKLIDALASYEFKKISTIEILKAVERRHPELMKEFQKWI